SGSRLTAATRGRVSPTASQPAHSAALVSTRIARTGTSSMRRSRDRVRPVAAAVAERTRKLVTRPRRPAVAADAGAGAAVVAAAVLTLAKAVSIARTTAAGRGTR